jgi:hypothetical protein
MEDRQKRVKLKLIETYFYGYRLARKRLDRDTFDLVEVGLMIEHLMEI